MIHDTTKAHTYYVSVSAEAQAKVIAAADVICAMIAQGAMMIDVSREVGIAVRTITRTAEVNETFNEMYRDAREQQIALAMKRADEVTKEDILQYDAKYSSALVRQQELRVNAINQQLKWLDIQRFAEAKIAQTFVDVPEFVAAESAADKLKVLSNAAATKRISLEASEKLAKLCEAQFKMDDVLTALKSMSERLSALETDEKPELNLIKSA